MAPTAKRRLAHVLSGDERIRLVRNLFGHVVSVLLDAGLAVIALAPDHLEVPKDVEVWRDEASGLNRAVGAALGRIGAPVLVVHADLPRIGVSDVDRIVASRADVTIARAHDGGTNALLMRTLIAPAFGPASAAKHASRARAEGLAVSVLDIPGLALDVDDESTLSAYAGASALRRRP